MNLMCIDPEGTGKAQACVIVVVVVAVVCDGQDQTTRAKLDTVRRISSAKHNETHSRALDPQENMKPLRTSPRRHKCMSSPAVLTVVKT